MITNDRQYKIAKTQIGDFQESLAKLSYSSDDTEDIHPKILQAEKDAINYQLQLLLKDITEYEDLKAGKIFVTEVSDVKDLPIVLIKARIANGMTQGELAEKLSVKDQQIQKYESERYESASLKTMITVADILGIKLEGDAKIKSAPVKHSIDASLYPFKQMFKRNWFPGYQGSLNTATQVSSDLIHGLYTSAGVSKSKHALARRTIRTKMEVNQHALDAWYAHVYIKARDQQLSTFFSKETVTPDWISQLVTYSYEDNGPEKAVEFLKNSGVRVVFEGQLEGTHLDGMAFLIDKLYPVIAMTLRYDRLDNFWFVLLHEFAHIVLHLNEDLTTIFDDLDLNANNDKIESEADHFALQAFISDEIWKKSLVRFSPSPITINNLAKKIKVHPSIIAGRIRREKGQYYLFNELVGQGEVRKFFVNQLNN